jgi:hypothetical protein
MEIDRRPFAAGDELAVLRPKLAQQLRSNPKKWAGIAAGAGLVLGLAGRYLRHRAHKPHLVIVEAAAC